jgi:pimeloyl-ACP methyl ester carboxylesterase
MVRTAALRTGVTLNYFEQGRPSGAPVILLHGVTDSWRAFEPVLDRLPDTIRALAISQRGHGASTKPEDGYRYADMAGDVTAFMDALAVPAAVIVGHSMGAMVAQRFAADHPSRVAGLVLMGAFRTLHRNTGIQQFWDSALSTLTDPVDADFAREFQLSTLARPVPPEFLNMVVHQSLLVPARVWRATFSGFLETPDFSHELRRLQAPTLIAWGDLDAYAGRANQEALQAAIPGSRRVTYPGAGHAFHWEDPQRFVDDLLTFIYEPAAAARAATGAALAGL